MTATSPLATMSALDLAAAISDGQLSALEVTVDVLERAERCTNGAFVTLAHQAALTRAALLDARPAIAQHSPLRGVPVPIKDLQQVRGLPTRGGSVVTSDEPAQADDGATIRFREAGTVMVGKTSTPEFGLPAYTEPEGQVPARTPWDPRRTAGGSSGGAAVAVATGLVPLAHASDGGGSIRIPASCCGLVGHKPSRGLVSWGPSGVDGVQLSTQGVLSRTVRDTAAGLDALAIGWPGDGLRPLAGAFLASVDEAPRRLRIGVTTQPFNVDTVVHRACIDAVAATASMLQGLGHEVVEAPRPYDPERWAAFIDLWSVMALGVPVDPSREHELRPLTRWLRELGRGVTGLRHAQAVAATQHLTRDVALAWQGLDVVVTPTLAVPPVFPDQVRHDDDPERDFWDQTRFTPWTSTANLTGRPSVSLPLHTTVVDDVRLPVGVMFTGQLGEDLTLLRLAREVEQAAGWLDPVLATVGA